MLPVLFVGVMREGTFIMAGEAATAAEFSSEEPSKVNPTSNLFARSKTTAASTPGHGKAAGNAALTSAFRVGCPSPWCTQRLTG